MTADQSHRGRDLQVGEGVRGAADGRDRADAVHVVIASQWTDAKETERGIAWARETFASLNPYLAPTRYVNYLEGDAVEPAAVAYGANLPRLREIKTKYDPDNFFRHNVNIQPL